MYAVTSLLGGLVFGLGLIISGMVNPAKVLGFLDMTGRDVRCLLGSIAFGVGWGMVGFCPGPALVALGSGRAKAFVFVAAMLAGMALFELIERLRDAHGIHPPARSER